MAVTNRERVGTAIDALTPGLAQFVKREFTRYYKGQTGQELQKLLGVSPTEKEPFEKLDTANLLNIMARRWQEVFRPILGPAERNYVSELQEARTGSAHQGSFAFDDTYRILDSAYRLLTAVSSPLASDIAKSRDDLMRSKFEEQSRTDYRRNERSFIENTTGITPWRDVVTPHIDVSSGRYSLAEFAADLWQVYLGEGTPEYRDPKEFFRRTYLTESLRGLLVNCAERLSGLGGEPTIELATNFGGGKTHSMLALFHLFSGIDLNEIPEVESLLSDANISSLPEIKRVVIVGNKISPSNPATKDDGTVVATLWGEIAWQIGGKEAFGRLGTDDKMATNPGDTLKMILEDYGPCLILIDEWVAYARQLHEEDDLAGGSFGTQFTFAQTLTEAARAVPNCSLVISLPMSTSADSPTTMGEDIEVGGDRGRLALKQLRNISNRLATQWTVANAEEGFEIVRRRLFEPLVERSQFTTRDAIAKQFSEFYRAHPTEFPTECGEGEYERRMIAAFPIHPEVFDRLYSDWSGLVTFQRTRGVLRLMAKVIHSLWESGDRNPLILPAHLPIDDPEVREELSRYLPDNWTPIIQTDIDGPQSLPVSIDRDIPNLGRINAATRAARTVYLGSAPTPSAANKGVEARRIILGSMIPGETPSLISDALRRLSARATYLYQDGDRYWYSTQPTINRLAQDRVEQLINNPELVRQEIIGRIRKEAEAKGEFSRVHVFPESGGDVLDMPEVAMVILGNQYPHASGGNSLAVQEALKILENRGASPRLNRNSLVFLAADAARYGDLDEAIREYLAWSSILAEKASPQFDLSQTAIRNVEQQMASADSAIGLRMTETYRWLIVPIQPAPDAALEMQAIRTQGDGSLVERSMRKLVGDELLTTRYGAPLLRMQLENLLWRGGNHISVRQLIDDYARYTYLPKLTKPDVLAQAISDGIGMMWEQDGFALAESFDDENSRYRGLSYNQNRPIDVTDPGLIVRSAVARAQIESEVAVPEIEGGGTPIVPLTPLEPSGTPEPAPTEKKSVRFHGSVSLNPERTGRDASVIADEVLAHLTSLLGAKAKVTLEIEVEIPEGAPDGVIRTVTENSRTLKFDDSGFETE